MAIDDHIGLSGLTYKSDAILERRRRILRETRRLIAETGYSSFNIRELCARAEIAPKTLYNAFGNKDNVVASAIQEFISDTYKDVHFHFPASNIDGFLERQNRIHSRNQLLARYTKAIVSVYYASESANVIRTQIRTEGRRWHAAFTAAIEEEGCLLAGVTTDWISHLLLSNAFSVTKDWACGEIADEAFLDRIAETALMVIVGTTRGRVNQDARRWIEDIRGDRASWISLRSMTSYHEEDDLGETFDNGAPSSPQASGAETVPKAKAAPRRRVPKGA